MSTRIASAIIILAVLIPIFILGGWVFNILVFIISLLAIKEFMDAKTLKKPLPFPIKIIIYIFMALIVLFDVNKLANTFSLDYRVLAALFSSLLLPVVLYHNKEKYSINDAFYMIGGVLFLGISMALIIMLREYSYKLVMFLFIITILTDTFAYVTGLLIGKHKLLPEISPQKTWEGLIGGIIVGVFASAMFYYTCINPEVSIIKLIFACIFLSLVGQFGDLVFSALKRHFNLKDFSNIIPGHGGILDRLDSIIFVLLGFTFFITFL